MNKYYTRRRSHQDINFDKGTVTPGANNYLCCKRRLARKEKKKRQKQGDGSAHLPRNGEETREKRKPKRQVRERIDKESAPQACEGPYKMLLELVTAALRLGQSLDGSDDVSTLIDQLSQTLKASCDKRTVISAADICDLPTVFGGVLEKRVDDIADYALNSDGDTEEVTVPVIKEGPATIDSDSEAYNDADTSDEAIVDANKEDPAASLDSNTSTFVDTSSLDVSSNGS
jgi:hypothetical protein